MVLGGKQGGHLDGDVMVVGVAIFNVAIALLCLMLSWRVMRFQRQLTQLNHILSHWTGLAESSLPEHTLAFTQHRAQLRQWQLTHLKWQLQQRQLVQIAKFLQLVWLVRRRGWHRFF
ncbi:MAG: hypothetical protein AAF959_15705 [Cyanobacteria bacterium P01_D01_bin.56]